MYRITLGLTGSESSPFKPTINVGGQFLSCKKLFVLMFSVMREQLIFT